MTMTSSLLRSRAWAKGIKGPKWPAPWRVLIKTRIGEQDVPARADYSRTRAFRRGWIATAMPTPAASISTSTGVPWRPSTNVWWNSSLAA